ncbi:MAG: DUF460 domain-containing protein [Candidatus Aenigmarchaeota archaeon]|nr:DUF460 domain-containing protein [Candidatus Aenigmarchaeota archaeon]
MAKSIIVGYDPGTTAALAIIDTNKNILYLKSKKEFRKKEIVEAITKKGKPIIVAGDRSPLPKSVEKLASSLGCKAFEPDEDLTNLEKYRLVREFMDVVKNDHQRDALASALKAHKNYSGLFKKTDKTISYIGLSEYYDKILKALIQGEAENINDAVNLVLSEIREKKERYVKEKGEKIREVDPKEVEKLRRMIKRQENDIEILKNYNNTLKARLEKVDEKFKEQKIKDEKFHDRKKLGKNEYLYKLKRELEKKEIVIKKLKILRKLENKSLVPIIDLEKIKPDKVDLLDKMLDLEGRVVSADNFINIRVLDDHKIQALISPTKPDEEVLRIVNYPIIPKDELSIRVEDDISVVEKKEFDEKLKKARKSGFIQWVNNHKKRRL